MAAPRVSARRVTCAAILSSFFLSVAPPAFAARPVIDVKSIAESKKQLMELKKQLETQLDQLEVLEQAREINQATQDAIGAIGSIQIPTVNFTKISGQIMGDMGCLVPDYKNLMPSLSSQDLDIDMSSICQRSTAYRTGLLASLDTVKQGTWQEKQAIVSEVKANRVRTVTDASTKGLAQADMAQERAVETLRAAQEYKSAGASAKTVNDRLQILIELQVAQLATMAQTNQLLAQHLKVLSATSVISNVPIENALAEDPQDGED